MRIVMISQLQRRELPVMPLRRKKQRLQSLVKWKMTKEKDMQD
jgi:hypothetical protein